MSSSEDHWDHMYKEGTKSAWTNNPLVADRVMRRITGTSKFWLNWVFEDYLKKPVDSILSIGCGDGAHELMIARNGYARTIDAFDASPVGIERARKVAHDEGLTSVHFRVDTFEHFIENTVTKKYDLIVAFGALHHVLPLEAMLEKIASNLAEGGYFLFNEYVGACYNIYPPIQVALINRLLAALDPAFKSHPQAQWHNPSFQMVREHDLSESCRSALILPLVGAFFDVEHRAFFGGPILHPIFDYLDGKRLGDGSPEAESVVGLLVEIEEILLEQGVLPHDFCLAFCKVKGNHKHGLALTTGTEHIFRSANSDSKCNSA